MSSHVIQSWSLGLEVQISLQLCMWGKHGSSQVLFMFVCGPQFCGEPSSHSHLKIALILFYLVHLIIVEGVKIIEATDCLLQYLLDAALQTQCPVYNQETIRCSLDITQGDSPTRNCVL